MQSDINYVLNELKSHFVIVLYNILIKELVQSCFVIYSWIANCITTIRKMTIVFTIFKIVLLLISNIPAAVNVGRFLIKKFENSSNFSSSKSLPSNDHLKS
jgi:hypothetical protein